MVNKELKRKHMIGIGKKQKFEPYAIQEIYNCTNIDVERCIIKTDLTSKRSGRLSLSFKELVDFGIVNPTIKDLVKSGIFGNYPKGSLYVQGYPDLFFAFLLDSEPYKMGLREWFEIEGKQHTHVLYDKKTNIPTLMGAFLPIEYGVNFSAWNLCVASFNFRSQTQEIRVNENIVKPVNRTLF